MHTSQRPKRPELIPVSLAEACLGVLLLPPGRDASHASQGTETIGYYYGPSHTIPDRAPVQTKRE